MFFVTMSAFNLSNGMLRFVETLTAATNCPRLRKPSAASIRLVPGGRRDCSFLERLWFLASFCWTGPRFSTGVVDAVVLVSVFVVAFAFFVATSFFGESAFLTEVFFTEAASVFLSVFATFATGLAFSAGFFADFVAGLAVVPFATAAFGVAALGAFCFVTAWVLAAGFVEDALGAWGLAVVFPACGAGAG